MSEYETLVKTLRETVNNLDELHYNNPNVREAAYNKGVSDAANRLRKVLPAENNFESLVQDGEGRN